MSWDEWDLLVLGGGPAGTTAAMKAARNGLRTLVIERETHPRFHIGESFLPRNTGLMRELGLDEKLAAIPQTIKKGASFGLGGEAKLTDFRFDNGTPIGDTVAWNIERAPFDLMLRDAAVEAGATIREGVAARSIVRLSDGDVAVLTEEGEIRAKWLIDASGQGTVVARHLRTRVTLPDLKKVAYFGHFRNVSRREGDPGGNPIIVMCREGWFWFIPITHEVMSIGLVMDGEVAQSVVKSGVPASRMLAWGIDRCPLARRLFEGAEHQETNHICADFSYTCRPYAGAGHFLVGDAATFVDPIFSTGVCLGMMSAVRAADAVSAIIKDKADPRPLRKAHCRYIEASSSAFFRLVRRYYRHEFREMFLHGAGPLNVHGAVLATLAGHVFPRPPWKIRWRMRLFEALMEVHRQIPLVPRRRAYSLVRGCEMESKEVRGSADPRSLMAWVASMPDRSSAEEERGERELRPA